MHNNCQVDGCEKQPNMMCKVLMIVDGIKRVEKIDICWGCYEKQLGFEDSKPGFKEGQGR